MRSITSKIFLTLALFAALAAAPGGQARGQWVHCDGPYSGATAQFFGSDPYIYAANYGGLFRSSDGGMIWKGSDAYPYFPTLKASKELLIGIPQGTEYTNPDGLYSYTNAVFISKDNGATWNDISSKFSHGTDRPYFSSPCATDRSAFVIESDFLNDNVADPIVYRSTDSGTTWIPLNQPLYAIFAVNDLVIGVRSDGVWLRSSDQGNSWDSIAWSNYGIQDMVETRSGIYVSSRQNPNPGDCLLLASVDTGKTWQPQNNGLRDFNIFSHFAASNDTLIAGTKDSGIFISTNSGESWFPFNDGLPTHKTQDVALINGTFLATAQTHSYYPNLNIYKASHVGAQWTPLNCKWGSLTVDALMDFNGKIIAGTPLGFYSSEDSGWTWDPVNDWNSDSLLNSLIYHDAGIAALGLDDGMIFVGTDCYEIARSTNNGNTWELSSFISDSVPGGFGFAFANHRIFANTDYNLTWPTGNYTGLLFMSSDSGINWSAIQPPVTSNHSLWSIDTLNGSLVIGTDQNPGLLVSSDDGTNWSSFGTSPGFRIIDIAVANGDIFVATSDLTGIPRIYCSTDGGKNWVDFSQGLSISGYLYKDVRTLVSSSGYLLAGTASDVEGGPGAGVWRRPLSDFGISSVAQTPAVAQPDIQSFPNPFTQSTEITFTTQAAGYAEVSIVNALGAEVARLFAGELGSGNHSFTWNSQAGTPAPCGVYWCVVKRNGRVETQPIALVR